MSIRKTVFAQDEYYHIYNRGNSKQKIFHVGNDYERFIKMLYLANSERNFKFRDVVKNLYTTVRGKQIVAIGAYCLMPNHFHLVVKEIEENGLTRFMQKLTTAYSMYYNTKYKRVGALFEGKFKSEHLADDRYLKYIFSYTHLNPIKLLDPEWKEKRINSKSSILRFLDGYKYSSYADYKGIVRIENVILNRESFPDYFPSQEKFSREISDWIDFND